MSARPVHIQLLFGRPAKPGEDETDAYLEALSNEVGELVAAQAIYATASAVELQPGDAL